MTSEHERYLHDEDVGNPNAPAHPLLDRSCESKPDTAQSTALDYVQRVNRAIDHVLSQPGHSRCRSRPSRRCRRASRRSTSTASSGALIGETLNQFVKRLRLERALGHPLPRAEIGPSPTIALACGFGSSSDFSRSFKQRYGVPPSAFDVDRCSAVSDGRGLAGRDRRPRSTATSSTAFRPARTRTVSRSELRRLPARCVAYIRVADPFRPLGAVTRPPSAWSRGPRRAVAADGQWLGYMWDDPEIVASRDCRYDVGVEVDHVEPDGEIGRIDFPEMLVAQVEVRGAIDLEQRALDWLFGTWLPSSGYAPSEQPCFEAWIGRPFAHGHGHFELFAQLPVTRG